jgi:putative tricarboxylic transport membrane protein
MKALPTLLFPLAMLLAAPAATAAPAAAGRVECIVPSKPGGAMDLTCKLAQKGLQALSGGAPRDVHISYVPGGIGAVAWHSLMTQRRADPNTLVVFSGGSLLNLAQGKFGKAKADDVRWVAALKKHPEKVLIGVSGTIGSQDWLKIALVMRTAGVDPKVLRFVALEGGGEAFTAMDAGYVHVVSGDASEATLYAANGKTRVLAVLSEQRLPGVLAAVPTAREQGVDVVWPIIRGVWMGPHVPEADYRQWVQVFDRMMATPQFAQARAAYGLYPFALTGDALADYVRKAVDDYGRRASEFGLVR